MLDVRYITWLGASGFDRVGSSDTRGDVRALIDWMDDHRKNGNPVLVVQVLVVQLQGPPSTS